MKKFICLLLAIVLTFSFSACGGKSSQEEVTTPPPKDFSVKQLAEAYLSGNGAIYDSFVNEISFKEFNFEAIVDRVEGLDKIDCDAAYWDVYAYQYGLRVQGIDLTVKIGQSELLKTLKPEDKIEFVGTLDQVTIYDSDYPGVTFLRFVDVTIKTVNGTAV